MFACCPDEEIKFKLLENHWVQVTCDRKTYKLVGMSKDNFPALPAFPHALVQIPAKLLADVIAKTTFAISLEESRYTLNGALLVLKPNSITMVATDGHRLAMVETDHKFEGFSAETRVLVPKKAMTEVQRLAADGRRRRHGRFRAGRKPPVLPIWRTPADLAANSPANSRITKRCCRATRTRPSSSSARELQDALRRVSQLADQRSHAVKFMLAKEGLEISASSPEYGEAKEAIDKEFNGEPIAIGFNAQYLLDFLARRCRWPHQLRAEGRTIRRPTAPDRRRIHPLPLRRHAHAHLTCDSV